MGPGSFYLLKERRFLPLFITQFFSAFNDNAFKLAMLTLISYQLTHSQTQSENYQAIAGALFTLPFFLFSATSGQIADKVDKALMTRAIKVFELVLMIIGAIGLCWGNIPILMITLTGMGVHSAFFGPIKYAILPDHLPKQNLLGATGLIEASTFLAILLGTTLGTLTIGVRSGHVLYAIFLTVIAATIGLLASWFIPEAPSSLKKNYRIDWNIFRATLNMLRDVRGQKTLNVPILTLSWFWLIGAVILTKLPDYTHYVLNADNMIFAVFLALFSIGMATGSVLINKLLSGQVTLKFVPLSMILVSFFLIDLYFASPELSHNNYLYDIYDFFKRFQHWRIAVDLFLLSFSAGLFVVPLYTHLQVYSEPGSRARTIAANNIYNALFMVLGSVLVMGLIYFEINIPQVFLVLSILNAAVSMALFSLIPKLKHAL